MAIKLQKDKLVRGLVNNYKLVPHLDKAIQDAGDFDWDFEFRSKKGDDAWHPSGDCLSSCIDLYNHITGNEEPEVIPGGLRKTFAVGHFWHAYIQHIVVEILGFSEWADIETKGTRVWGMEGDGKPKPYQYAQGQGDITTCNIPKHGDYLIDIKTCNSIDFNTPGLPARFAKKYTAQANIYMDWFDKEKAIILKVRKDSPHEFAEVELQRNQPLIDAIYAKWQIVGFCYAEKFPPDPALEIELPF